MPGSRCTLRRVEERGEKEYERRVGCKAEREGKGRDWKEGEKGRRWKKGHTRAPKQVVIEM
jgi:hypothetical protein